MDRPGITSLLTFTLLTQMTVLSEHHRTRQRHYLQLLDCKRRLRENSGQENLEFHGYGPEPCEHLAYL